MLTFAFTVLVLLLAALVGVFAYRYAIAKERSIWRQKRRVMQARINQLAKQLETNTAKQNDFDKRFTELEITARKDLGLQATPKDMFSAMEQRHAKKLSTVIGIGGDPIDKAA